MTGPISFSYFDSPIPVYVSELSRRAAAGRLACRGARFARLIGEPMDGSLRVSDKTQNEGPVPPHPRPLPRKRGRGNLHFVTGSSSELLAPATGREGISIVAAPVQNCFATAAANCVRLRLTMSWTSGSSASASALAARLSSIRFTHRRSDSSFTSISATVSTARG